jgi:hypothetical protein
MSNTPDLDNSKFYMMKRANADPVETNMNMGAISMRRGGSARRQNHDRRPDCGLLGEQRRLRRARVEDLDYRVRAARPTTARYNMSPA